jgi:hypothetical protein
MRAIFSRMTGVNVVCQQGIAMRRTIRARCHAPPLFLPRPTDPVTDLNSRHAAMALGLSLPADVVLYLLLPMYASQFGVTLGRGRHAARGQPAGAHRGLRLSWRASTHATATG